MIWEGSCEVDSKASEVLHPLKKAKKEHWWMVFEFPRFLYWLRGAAKQIKHSHLQSMTRHYSHSHTTVNIKLRFKGLRSGNSCNQNHQRQTANTTKRENNSHHSLWIPRTDWADCSLLCWTTAFPPWSNFVWLSRCKVGRQEWPGVNANTKFTVSVDEIRVIDTYASAIKCTKAVSITHYTINPNLYKL